MSSSAVFQTQLASVIDTMAKTAMTEIIKLVDDYSAILRWEMYRSQSENEGLRKKIEVIENERHITHGESIAAAGDVSGNETLIIDSDTSRGQCTRKVAEFDAGNPLFLGKGFANQDCNASRDGAAPYEGETKLPTAFLKDEPSAVPASDPELLIIKEEGPEDDFGISDAGRQLETSAGRKWEEQGARQCPAVPVTRKPCEEEWAEEDADEPAGPHRTGHCMDQLSDFESFGHEPKEQYRKISRESDHSEGSLASPCSEFISYSDVGVRSSDTEADELAFCYPPQQQEVLQQYGPTGDQAALNRATAESNSDPPGKTLRAEKQLSCMYCGKSFPYLSYLKRHISNHTGERPHRCTECGRCFIRRSHLVRHQQVHTGVKPFDCTLCRRRFARLSHLDRHLSTHV